MIGISFKNETFFMKLHFIKCTARLLCKFLFNIPCVLFSLDTDGVKVLWQLRPDVYYHLFTYLNEYRSRVPIYLRFFHPSHPISPCQKIPIWHPSPPHFHSGVLDAFARPKYPHRCLKIKLKSMTTMMIFRKGTSVRHHQRGTKHY